MTIRKLYHAVIHFADRHPYLSFLCLLAAAATLLLFAIFVLTAAITFPIACFLA